MYSVKIVSWTRERVIPCHDYETRKVVGGNRLILYDEDGVDIFDHIMEEWMGEENVRVYITLDGKHYDSKSFFPANADATQRTE